jgi:MFS family permease
MLPLTLFGRGNFTWGNIETLVMYAGLSILIFFLVLFLQQVAGYSPLESGLATLPITGVMLVASRRFGALADRRGPRFFMAVGPMVAAAGLLLLLRVNANADYLRQILPPMLLFSLGLSMTVAPLTAAVLADVPEHRAGIASAVNNAIARIAGLLGTSALGAVIAAQFAAGLHQRLPPTTLDAGGRAAVASATRLSLGRPPTNGLAPAERRRIDDAAVASSVHTFHVGMGISAGLVALGGMLAAIGIRNPRRRVLAEYCEGGALVGASRDAAGCPRTAEPAPAPATATAV